MMKHILVALALCAAASPALAEDGGVVGQLVTPNGTPITGYPVVVSGKTESGRRAGLDFYDRLHWNLYGERAASGALHLRSGQ